MRFCCYSAGKAFGLNRTDIFDGSKLFINQMVLSPIEKLNENWAKNAIENEWKTHGNRIYIIGQVDAERWSRSKKSNFIFEGTKCNVHYVRNKWFDVMKKQQLFNLYSNKAFT